MKKVLEDIKVLDLSRILAGPYASMILGDFGARIIKVERPEKGDDTRQWGPPFTENGESAYFFCANRNKESITLNLKSEEGRQILRKLASQADVLVENFKVGTMKRLGLDYESLRQENPGLIYCSITGYGQTGPYRDRPGYDIMIEAQGGIMSITGPPDHPSDHPSDQISGSGEPFKVGVAIVDITSGLYAVISILAALRHREETGQGQSIDIALFDTQLSWLANVASSYLVSGQKPPRVGNAHASIVPYQTMPTSDGWLMLAVGNDRQYAALCQVIEHPEWATDPRFATNPARVEHREHLVPLLEARFRTKSATQWSALLLEAGVPCSPVNDIPTALADPQAIARNMVQQVEHPQTGTISLLGPAPKLSLTPPQIAGPPPVLGEHTDVVLNELLGYTETEIAQLRAAHVL